MYIDGWMLYWECGATDRVDRERGSTATNTLRRGSARIGVRARARPSLPILLRASFAPSTTIGHGSIDGKMFKCYFDFIMILMMMIIPQSCNYPCSNLSFRTFGDDSDCCDWVFVASRDCGGCCCCDCHCCYYYYYGQPRVDHWHCTRTGG